MLRMNPLTEEDYVSLDPVCVGDTVQTQKFVSMMRNTICDASFCGNLNRRLASV